MPAWMDSSVKRVTIDQVAKLSGVSKTTVSHYLNGKYDALAEDTRERIRAVIEELGYRPNRIAQSLKAKNSRMLGCLVSDISSPFSSVLVKGINGVCREADYQLLLVDSGDDPVREREGIRNLLENQVDGLIVNATGENDDYLLSLKEQGVPLVLADRCLTRPGLVDTVTTDSYDTTYRCVSYLYELGYRQVAFFTQGNGRVSPRILRFKGFSDALRDRFGQDGEEHCYQFSLDDQGTCVAALEEFLGRYPGERLAAFAVNGVTLLHLLQAIQASGIVIGENFGVCGFDDWGWASLIPPGITTIAQDSRKVGRRAAQILLDRIAGIGPPEVLYEELPSKLEIRGSTVKSE